MSQNQMIRNHMEIVWHDYTDPEGNVPIREASLIEKASIIGRTGLEMLSCGTGAWRVRSSMNALSRELGVTTSVDIGLMTINYNCFDGTESVTQSLSLTNTGVNTAKLNRLEHFVNLFPEKGLQMTGEELHQKLDEIEETHGLYTPVVQGLAAGIACFGFTFLLGGGIIEMLLAFLGAFVGNGIRAKLIQHHFTLFMNVAVSVAAACLTYAAGFAVLRNLFHIPMVNEAGYICAMLFIIPGFPFITSGIDLAKLDLRSGLERMTYAVIIILVATLAAWIMALVIGLHPMDFVPLGLTTAGICIIRILTSFCGVFGFSMMFNSPRKLAAIAALIGAVSNTTRLELVDLAGLPPAFAAFIGAFISGILASVLKKHLGYPRISITVPSIVIMVPGMYFYKAIYNMGVMHLSESASWFASAALIVLSLPLGLIFARICTDRSFRYCT